MAIRSNKREGIEFIGFILFDNPEFHATFYQISKLIILMCYICKIVYGLWKFVNGNLRKFKAVW